MAEVIAMEPAGTRPLSDNPMCSFRWEYTAIVG